MKIHILKNKYKKIIYYILNKYFFISNIMNFFFLFWDWCSLPTTKLELKLNFESKPEPPLGVGAPHQPQNKFWI